MASFKNTTEKGQLRIWSVGEELRFCYGITGTLSHYHTTAQFDALKIYSCEKHCEKRRNCLLKAISPFLTMFSTLYGTFFLF